MENVNKRPRSNDYRYDDERLRFVLGATGLPTGTFARMIGLPDSELLYQIKSGKAPLSPLLAARIHACFPQFDRQWLFTGKAGGNND